MINNSTDSYIQTIINQLMPKLREYISSKGVQVQPNGFFSCIHPHHPDRNPSCSLGGKYNETVFHCFSQGHSGNIFTAAHWLENMPIHDGNFYNETLVRLCDQFGIDYKPIELSDDAKRLYTRRQANNDALRTIQNSTFEMVDGVDKLKTTHAGIKFLLERGINEQTITNFKISVIDSNKSYLDAMIELGWENKNDLQGYDLSNTNIFSANGFIIPIFDDNSMLVGFVTRNIRHSANDKTTSKYYNTNNNDLYQKGSILFNYNNVKKLTGPLFIVEGYLDAAYMVQEGIDKTVAVGSTVLSEKHIAMLAEDKNTDIILVYDGDEGGSKGIELALERLSDYSSFNIKIIDLPAGYDPDTYIKEFGVDEFNVLQKYSPFSWTLKHAEWSADLSLVAQKAIPIIAAEQSAVVRVGMIKELSNFSAISETDIRKDVDNILSKEKDEYLRELGELNGFVVSQLQRKSIRETSSIIKSAIQRIDHINDRYIVKSDTKNDFFDKINTFENKIIDGHFKYGLITSKKFKSLEKLLDGIPYWANLMMFGGRPSAGKTAIITDLSLDLIKENEDLAIFYMSIDDSTELMLQKMISSISGLSVQQVKSVYSSGTKEQKEKFHEAMTFLKRNSERYVIADASQGNTLETFESHANYFSKNFSGMKKLMVLDNFHKLGNDGRKTERKDILDDASSRIKTISQSVDIPVMMSIELRKLANETDRPTRQDLQGTNKLDYDADLVALVHSDLMVNKDTQLFHEVDFEGEKLKQPIVEVNVCKNKINGEVDILPFKFNRKNMTFSECSKGEYNQKFSQSKSRVIKFGGNTY